LLNESRRRAYLNAMQVVPWVPRTELPFAAPSRPQLLQVSAPVEQPLAALNHTQPTVEKAPAAGPAALLPPERPKVSIPRPALKIVKAEEPVAVVAVVADRPVPATPPRFALQLLRAGGCLILAELPTGQPFQSRDPAYLLLKDLLRAAGLPDSPQIVGEPVRWPLLQRGNLDQGPEAARDFVQGFVQAQLEEASCLCLWLVGLAAIRFAAQGSAEDYDRQWPVEGLGEVWGLPGLELLMDEPLRKASLWQAMRRLMPRWKLMP
jgi:hypothetical protein